jgi:hypothetical protein
MSGNLKISGMRYGWAIKVPPSQYKPNGTLFGNFDGNRPARHEMYPVGIYALFPRPKRGHSCGSVSGHGGASAIAAWFACALRNPLRKLIGSLTRRICGGARTGTITRRVGVKRRCHDSPPPLI